MDGGESMMNRSPGGDALEDYEQIESGNRASLSPLSGERLAVGMPILHADARGTPLQAAPTWRRFKGAGSWELVAK